MEAKVERPFQMMVWHSPANFKPGDAELDVLAGILSVGKTSRLYQRLVYELKIAQTVGASQGGNLLAGSFSVTFSPMPGHTLAEIEKLVDEELEKVRSEPVQSREIERVKNQIETGMFDGLESIAGRAGRLLAYNTYLGDPGYIGQDLARFQAVNATQIQQVASTVLRKDARLVITVEPNPEAPIMGRVKR
jgi:zinc protease